ncbi:uncharacterized protein LOC124705668 isoform X1 [Lolium rigidum]|uniref:uncharacterized protein LOC124705668 isoform X1 n=1 Tax=Lolium rigidum TaxID=89674 RepID=UPI001F5D1BF1|nr:uncharacterized protein LOC124705668 isoform X1 [Lolium rigidum]
MWRRSDAGGATPAMAIGGRSSRGSGSSTSTATAAGQGRRTRPNLENDRRREHAPSHDPRRCSNHCFGSSCWSIYLTGPLQFQPMKTVTAKSKNKEKEKSEKEASLQVEQGGQSTDLAFILLKLQVIVIINSVPSFNMLSWSSYWAWYSSLFRI